MVQYLVNEVPELHFIDSTAHVFFNGFNLFLTSLACDANALGSTKVEQALFPDDC